MIRIFTDGACSRNGTPNQRAGIGIVIEWNNTTPEIISKPIGNKTNNVAEYEALLEALMIIRNKEIKVCKIHSDSNLIVQQVNGNYKCKDNTLKQLCFLAYRRMEWLKENGWQLELVYIPRELNLADEAAKNGVKLNETSK